MKKEESKQENKKCECGSNYINTTDKDNPFCFHCGKSLTQEEHKQEFDRSKYIAGIYPIVEETLEERQPYWELVDKKAEENNTIDLDAYANGVRDGVNWQAERMYIEIEQKWLEYRSNTNNEDAWCFKEWLVEQFKSE